MKRLLFALLAILLIAGCSSGPEPDTDVGEAAPPESVPLIAGTYVVNGFDPGGTEYSGYLNIETTDEPDIYQLQWIVTGSVQEGTGTLAGNQLTVEWHTVEGFDSANGFTEGTATYTVTVKGILDGARHVTGLADAGTETAYPNDYEY